MKNTPEIRKLIKTASKILYLFACAGIVYLALPAVMYQSEMPALAKNQYAASGPAAQHLKLSEADFVERPLLASAIMSLDAADNMVQTSQSFDYRFNNGWFLTDDAVKLFTTPGKGVMAAVYANCDWSTRHVFGMASEAHKGYTVKQALMPDTAYALKTGVSISEHKGNFGMVEAHATSWWIPSKISAITKGISKKAELLKVFPGFELDCNLAKKPTSTLEQLTASLPEISQAGILNSKTTAIKAIPMATLGIDSMEVVPNPVLPGGVRVHLRAEGKSAEETKALKAAYEKALTLFSAAPVKSLAKEHREGNESVGTGFALIDGSIIASYRVEEGKAFFELLLSKEPSKDKPNAEGEKS